ncbi:uncharacterized protein V1510DRAFT_211581 [Dipodascopsis tothii]|uniref:uncharacterized protein n=1 Tax=Dipodascopsis tothii TaxID=44089 RepID=UPI0034CFBC39
MRMKTLETWKYYFRSYVTYLEREEITIRACSQLSGFSSPLQWTLRLAFIDDKEALSELQLQSFNAIYALKSQLDDLVGLISQKDYHIRSLIDQVNANDTEYRTFQYRAALTPFDASTWRQQRRSQDKDCHSNQFLALEVAAAEAAEYDAIANIFSVAGQSLDRIQESDKKHGLDITESVHHESRTLKSPSQRIQVKNLVGKPPQISAPIRAHADFKQNCETSRIPAVRGTRIGGRTREGRALTSLNAPPAVQDAATTCSPVPTQIEDTPRNLSRPLLKPSADPELSELTKIDREAEADKRRHMLRSFVKDAPSHVSRKRKF